MRILIKNKILNQCQITVSLFSSSGSRVQSTSRGRVRGPGPGNWEQGHIIHLAESRKGRRQSRLITKRRRCRRRINPLIKVTSKAAQRQKAIKASEMRTEKGESRRRQPHTETFEQKKAESREAILSPLPVAYLWPFFSRGCS